MKIRRGIGLIEILSMATLLIGAVGPTLVARGQGITPNWTGQQATVQKPERHQYSRQSGLQLIFDVGGLQSADTGYVAVVIDVEAQSPLASDTNIRVRFSTSLMFESADFTSQQQWTLAAGTARQTLRLEMPAYGVEPYCWWDVWVDGAYDRELSQKLQNHVMLPALMGGAPAEATPLRILDASHQLSSNSVWREERRDTKPLEPKDSTLAPNLLAGFHPQDLPDNWRELLPFDIVRVQIGQLERIKADRPRAFAALIRWVHAGGNLWVDGLGNDWQQLPRLTELLGYQDAPTPTSPRIATAEEAAGVGFWDAINLASRQMEANFEEEAAELLLVPSDHVSNEEVMSLSDGLKEPPPFYSDQWMVVRRLGWGRVGAFRKDWFTLPRGITPSRQQVAANYWIERSWLQRHGTNPHMANPEFSDWLVPGVGEAPVLEFQFLITLFVIVIGPLNYWLLKRARRLHLLVITVPLVAGVVTLGLLGYGLLADGWATRLRAMSITTIDHKQGIASSWSRLSYYASFAPRDGLVFHEDAQIYPILPGAYETYATSGWARSRSMTWHGEGQHLARGWLDSRTPTQYLVVESHRDAQGLKIGRRGGALIAESSFAAPLQWVAVIDEQGQWYEAGQVAGAGQFRLEPVSRTEAAATFRRLVQDYQPSIPPEMLEHPLGRRNRRRHFGGYGYWNPQGATSFATSLLTKEWNWLTGREGQPTLNLPPKTYIVVGQEHLMTQVGLEDLRESGSIHLVLGDW